MRQVLGLTFRLRVVDFKDLHSVAVVSAFGADRSKDTWRYALALVTRKARVFRVSTYRAMAPIYEARRLSRLLKIACFPCREEEGFLLAWLKADGTVALDYAFRATPWFWLTVAAMVATVLAVAVGCAFYLY